MAGSSLLVLLDDIAAILDDVATMTKLAAQKTAGVLGDDLAVNAEKVSGVQADRELPVVWAVAKGSMRNKCILVPAALVLSLLAGWLITPVLMLGGLYLCYEGFEKLAHALWHDPAEDADRHRELVAHLADPDCDLLEFERDKIRGAVRTDFILSAEIIVLTLGIVAEASFATQFTVLAGIAVMMTVGVYGVVAAIVKLDDLGLQLLKKTGAGLWPQLQRRLGAGLLAFAPWLMKALAVAGTAAMFMVGGGILVHGLHPLDLAIGHISAGLAAVGELGPMLAIVTPIVAGLLVGIAAGALVLGAVSLWQRIRA